MNQNKELQNSEVGVTEEIMALIDHRVHGHSTVHEQYTPLDRNRNVSWATTIPFSLTWPCHEGWPLVTALETQTLNKAQKATKIFLSFICLLLVLRILFAVNQVFDAYNSNKSSIMPFPSVEPILHCTQATRSGTVVIAGQHTRLLHRYRYCVQAEG